MRGLLWSTVSRARLAATLCLLFGTGLTETSLADPVPQQPEEAAPTASVTPLAAEEQDPAVDTSDATEATQLPPGHPPIDDRAAQAAPSTPTGPGGTASGSPLGSISPSPAIATGTLEVHVVNSSNQPVPGASVLLKIHRESVAEGNTDHLQSAVTDASGLTRFERLSADSAISYRLLLRSGSTQYGLQPFQLSAQQGMTATLRQLDEVRDTRKALVAADAMIFVEPRDDVFQFEVLYRLFNVGHTVWVPDDVQAELPLNRQAVNVQPGEDVHVEASDRGVRLVGAVTPGQHQVSFTFHVPRHNSPSATFEMGLFPNVMQARVGVASGKNTELTVDGFQDARVSATPSGQRLLVSGQVFDRETRPPRELRFEIRGLPTLGSGRIAAAIIATGLAAMGLIYTLRHRRKPQQKASRMLEERARERLLEELAELEAAKAAGTIGPRTYEDTRTTLVEALVRLEPAAE